MTLGEVVIIWFVLRSKKVPSEGCCRSGKANMLKISKTNLGQDIFMFILNIKRVQPQKCLQFFDLWSLILWRKQHNFPWICDLIQTLFIIFREMFLVPSQYQNPLLSFVGTCLFIVNKNVFEVSVWVSHTRSH